ALASSYRVGPSTLVVLGLGAVLVFRSLRWCPSCILMGGGRDSAHERKTDVKILMVLTSHDQLGNTGRKTGFWLEEFAAPYFLFRDAGVELTLASPQGGQPPIDPKSDLPDNQTPSMVRFKQDPSAQKAL